jgi:hypothetical protein
MAKMYKFKDLFGPENVRFLTKQNYLYDTQTAIKEYAEEKEKADIEAKKAKMDIESMRNGRRKLRFGNLTEPIQDKF